MKRRNVPPSIVFYLGAVVLMRACGDAIGSPAQNLHNNVVTGKFQAALQQQTFFSILTSIEERLKNLDNIYSMQLSQTLETKLEQYNRQLEAIDSKIIRLEALVMLNLDKISENISTKNFKDDMSRTNLLRKMDNVYEGISHRLGYMERKYESNLAKIQTKVENTLTRLEKIEENMAARDSDIEEEISDAIFAIDDMKTSCTSMEEKLYNITSASFNATKSSYKSMYNMNIDSRKSMNVLHDNIIETLKFMNNRTSRHFKLMEDNNVMLKNMKSELKEDFNDYANKVADMSSYVWKNSDSTEDILKRIETGVNNTKIEVQNGVRSLMVQIGKISMKENVIPTSIEGGISLNEINKNLKTNFQRILTNQDVFLESCHRLQMDESQIESEISVMLEKLIDMLEKRMTSEMKDIKNLEKILKTHDNRILRNVYQINSNVISLFEKSTTNNEAVSGALSKIKNDIDALFAFVQSTGTTTNGLSTFPIDLRPLQDQLNKLETMISNISLNETYSNLRSPSNEENLDVKILKTLTNFSENFSWMESHLKNTLNNADIEKLLSETLKCAIKNETIIKSNIVTEVDNNTMGIIEDIFGKNPVLKKPDKKECKKNYRHLIDVRSGVSEDCSDEKKEVKQKRKMKRKKQFQDLIDVRGNFMTEDNVDYGNSEESFESTTADSLLDLTTEKISTTEGITANTDNQYETVTSTAKPNETEYNFLNI